MCFAYFGFSWEECEDVAVVVGVRMCYGVCDGLWAVEGVAVVEVLDVDGELLSEGLDEWGVEELADLCGVDCGGHDDDSEVGSE